MRPKASGRTINGGKSSTVMETPEQQELRARRRFHPRACLKASLLAGGVTFFFSAGGPWFSQEAGFATMGRILTSHIAATLLAQAVFSLVYGGLLGALIYSPPTVFGILLGGALALPLYGLNFLIFRPLGYVTNELHVFLGHLFFCLVFSAAYRAMSVAPPRKEAAGKSEHPHPGN